MKRILVPLLLALLASATAHAETQRARYGVAETFNFVLYNADGTLDVDEADGGTEVSLSCDEGAETTATNDFVDEGTFYSIALTAAELKCERVAVVIAATTTNVFHIQTSALDNGVVAFGTAQSATGTTIVLAAATSFADDILNCDVVGITGGTGLGQTKTIVDWVSATDTATVTTWTTNPDNTSIYEVYHVPCSTFADDSITAAAIAANALGASEIATDAIGAAEIAADAIAASEIAADAIGTSELATGAITTAEFAAGAIDAAAVATDAIGAAELAANSITSSEVADDSIDAGALAADAIGASEIATDAIGAAEIAAAAIAASEVATDAIGAAELAADGATETATAVATIQGILTGTCDSGSTTTCVDNALTQADATQLEDRLMCFDDGWCGLITTFTPASDTATTTKVAPSTRSAKVYTIFPSTLE
jgi:hypothetical protein